MDLKVTGDPGQGNSYNETTLGHVDNYNPTATTVTNNYNYSSNSSRLASDFERLRQEILKGVKQETIEDKRVGAFFYNGRVYCKYLTHEAGKVYLCSYNSSYPPIEIRADDELIAYGAVVEVAT